MWMSPSPPRTKTPLLGRFSLVDGNAMQSPPGSTGTPALWDAACGGPEGSRDCPKARREQFRPSVANAHRGETCALTRVFTADEKKPPQSFLLLHPPHTGKYSFFQSEMDLL